MTKKNQDYKSGGGFVVKNNKVIDYETIADVGDVLIYNSNTIHGVLDVKGEKFPNFNLRMEDMWLYQYYLNGKKITFLKDRF